MRNRKIRNVLMAAVTAFVLAMPVNAAGLQESNLYTGAMALVNDITSALTVLCPLVGGAAALVFMIRRSMADEQDGKMWTKRMTTAIICGVGGMLVAGIIALLTSYF